MVSSKVYKILNRNTETKFIDTAIDGTTGIVFGTALIVNLSQMTQGTADTQRIGDRVKLKALNLKYNCIATDASNRMRVTIIRWKEDSSSSVPSNTQVYQNLFNTIQTFFQYDGIKSGKFEVLYDKCEDIELSNGNLQIYRHKYMKLNKFLGFTGSTSAKGHIYCIVNSDSGVIPHPSFDGIARLTYKDS
jgi:hypothetical protein